MAWVPHVEAARWCQSWGTGVETSLVLPAPRPRINMLPIHFCKGGSRVQRVGKGKLVMSKAFFLFLFFFLLLRATPMAFGSSHRLGVESELQLPSYTTATATPHLSHALRPISQLTATLDPSPTERGQGWNLCPHGC